MIFLVPTSTWVAQDRSEEFMIRRREFLELAAKASVGAAVLPGLVRPTTFFHHGESMSIITETASAAEAGTEEGLHDVLDFLVTEEQLGVTLLTNAIEHAAGTPSEAFLPVLRNGVTTEFYHVEALKKAGGSPLTSKFWFPDAVFDGGRVGLFTSLEIIETVEISLSL